MYAKRHPWLIADPDEPEYAYCKYCKKRLYTAMHLTKRLIHERGMAHRTAVNSHKRKLAGAETGNTSEVGEESKEESVEEDDGTEDEEEQMEADNEAYASEDATETDNAENEDDDNDKKSEESRPKNVDYRYTCINYIYIKYRVIRQIGGGT